MKNTYHADLIVRNTENALKACREEIDCGVLTGFTECVMFLSGYTQHHPVHFDKIIDQLREWYNEGVIRSPWGV